MHQELTKGRLRKVSGAVETVRPLQVADGATAAVVVMPGVRVGKQQVGEGHDEGRHPDEGDHPQGCAG